MPPDPPFFLGRRPRAGAPARWCRRSFGADVGAQAADSRHRHGGEQDRAYRVGSSDEVRDVPSSGRYSVGAADARLSV